MAFSRRSVLMQAGRAGGYSAAFAMMQQLNLISYPPQLRSPSGQRRSKREYLPRFRLRRQHCQRNWLHRGSLRCRSRSEYHRAGAFRPGREARSQTEERTLDALNIADGVFLANTYKATRQTAEYLRKLMGIKTQRVPGARNVYGVNEDGSAPKQE